MRIPADQPEMLTTCIHTFFATVDPATTPTWTAPLQNIKDALYRLEQTITRSGKKRKVDQISQDSTPAPLPTAHQDTTPAPPPTAHFVSQQTRATSNQDKPTSFTQGPTGEDTAASQPNNQDTRPSHLQQWHTPPIGHTTTFSGTIVCAPTLHTARGGWPLET
jgi:hypothetical protein